MPADHAWHLRFTRAVFHDVQRWGLSNADFIPTLSELLAMIEIDPYQFPEKRGSLSGARAAALTYRGHTWRAVYDIDDYAREASRDREIAQDLGVRRNWA